MIKLAKRYERRKNHTVFGRVIEGIEVVDDIRQGDKMLKLTVEEN